MDRVPVLLTAGLVLAGCGDSVEVAPEARVAYDTIDGVEHVISGSRGLWSDGAGWTLADGPALTIGQLDGPEEYTFGDVTGVWVADDGRVYVADTQALEVRAYSPDGEFLFRFGGNGEGPGEFGNISGLARAPEGIAVLDGQQARVSVFGLDGSLVRTFRIKRPFLIYDSGAPMAFDAAGRFHDRTILQFPEAPDSVGVVTYAPDGAPLDTAAVGARDPDLLIVMRDGFPLFGMIRPFTPRPSLSFGPDARAYFADGGRYHVRVFSPGGESVRVIRRDVMPPLVTGAERDSARDRVLERAREVGGTAPEDLSIPTTKPVIVDLEVDDTGHLWIQAQPTSGEDGLQWWVHGPDGRYLGVVETPRMDVMHIGPRFVAGVSTDELGVDRVVVMALER